MRCGVTDRGSE